MVNSPDPNHIPSYSNAEQGHHPTRQVNAERILSITHSLLDNAHSKGKEVSNIPGLTTIPAGEAYSRAVSEALLKTKSNHHGHIADHTMNPVQKVGHSLLSSYHANRAEHAYDVSYSITGNRLSFVFLPCRKQTQPSRKKL